MNKIEYNEIEVMNRTKILMMKLIQMKINKKENAGAGLDQNKQREY